MSVNCILENIEEVLMELTSFEKKFGKDDGAEIPQILDDYLVFVARTGNTHFPWMKIKPLFRSKLEKVIREFSQKSDEVPLTPNVDPFQFDVVKDTVFEQLEFFAGIPFTVQRLCELLTSPSKHYKRTDKFMRALEKNMLVVSTVEAVHPSASAVSNSSSIVSVTNGGNSVTESFSSTLEQREREAHLVNGSTTTSPSPSMSSDDDEKEGLKSDETEVYSPPQSNGNSQPDEQQIINGSSTDLETSGPCDSGESSSSSENSSPNPHVVPESSSSSSSDSTTNEAAVSSLKMEDLHDDESLHLKDELADELLPLTDSMEIDSECSSSENLLIEGSLGNRRRQEEIINDEVQSTDEDESTSALSTSSPCKRMKTCMDEEARRVDSLNEAVTREEGEVVEESDSPTSSKDDVVMQTDVVKSDTTISSMDSCCGSTDDDVNSRVSTSQDTTNEHQQQPVMKDSSSPPSSGTNEATPSTSSSSSVVSPVESSQNTENIDINNAKEEDKEAEEDKSKEKKDSVLNNDDVDTEVEQSS